MNTEAKVITARQAIKRLMSSGNAYVNAQITSDDVLRVRAVKADLIHSLRQMPEDTAVGLRLFSDGGVYPAMEFDYYGLK